jgi:hypothetical protein
MKTIDKPQLKPQLNSNARNFQSGVTAIPFIHPVKTGARNRPFAFWQLSAFIRVHLR